MLTLISLSERNFEKIFLAASLTTTNTCLTSFNPFASKSNSKSIIFIKLSGSVTSGITPIIFYFYSSCSIIVSLYMHTPNYSSFVTKEN